MDPISAAIWPYFVSIFVGIILVAIFFDKKREAKLSSIAKDLGFEFSASVKRASLSEHRNFDLLQIGQDRQVCKEMWGSRDGNDFRIFVYRYREHSGNKRWCSKTILSAKCSRLDAPAFSLQPKPKRLMMVPDFGQYASGIEVSTVLSQKYVIKGDDEEKIRELFNPAVVKFFEFNPGLYLEARQDTFLIHSSDQRSGYCDVEKLLAQGQELLSKLVN